VARRQRDARQLEAIQQRLRDAEAARLEAEHRATEALEQSSVARRQRDALLSSTSWRLTAPVRTTIDRIRRLGVAAPATLKVPHWRATPRLSDGLRQWKTVRAIARSGLFDAEYYLNNNPDVATAGESPLWHYVVHGAAEQRDPSPAFDTSYYAEANPDVAQAGINPLLHYVRHGAAEGRSIRPPDPVARIDNLTPLTAEGFVRYRFDKNACLGVHDDVLLYAAYCPDGLLTPLHVRSLEAYEAEGYRVALVVNSGAYNRMVGPGETPAAIQIVRENIGFDFGAWAHATRLIGGLEAVRSVTFTNDSVVGPLPGAVRLRARVDEIDADAVFMTECRQVHRHLQSYFFTLKAQALAKGALQAIQGAPYLGDKDRVIQSCELTLASRLEALDVSTAVAFPCLEADAQSKNPTIQYWRTLIDAGFPFLKVALVTAGILHRRPRAPRCAWCGISRAAADTCCASALT
jgi:hypothetical protein